MTRYLIEVRHENEHAACLRALDALERFGSHFVTQAEFGCLDGIHAGWLSCEADSREDALRMVPPAFRASTRVVEVQNFTREQIRTWVREFEAGSCPTPMASSCS